MGHSPESRQLQRRLEQDDRAGPVVVAAGAFRDAVEVGSGHHDFLSVTTTGLGEKVESLVTLDALLEREAQRHFAVCELPAQPVALGSGDTGDRDVLRTHAVEGAVKAGIAVVGDDHRGRAGGGSDPVDLLEAAAPAFHQGELAGHCRVPVGPLAAVPACRLDQPTADALGGCARREGQRDLVDDSAMGVGQP